MCEAASAFAHIGREIRRPLEARGRRADSAASLGAKCRGLELRRHLVVGSDRGRGPVPRPPIRVVREHRRERCVRGPAVRVGRRLRDRRSHERVAEPELHGIEVDEPYGGRLLEGRHRVHPALDPGARHEDLAHIAGVVDRRHQQLRVRRRRKLVHPRREGSFEPGGEWEQLGKRRRSGDLLGGEGRRQLQQGEWIPLRFLEDARPHGRRELRSALVEELSRGHVVQALETELGQTRVREHGVVPLADPEQERHRIARESTSDEGEHRARPEVQPLRVLRDRQESPFGRLLGEEIQGPEPDEEPAGRIALALAEGRRERIPLRPGQPIGSGEDRAKELMESGERESRLRLHSGRGEDSHPAIARGVFGFEQQRRLADPRRSGHDQ